MIMKPKKIKRFFKGNIYDFSAIFDNNRYKSKSEIKTEFSRFLDTQISNILKDNGFEYDLYNDHVYSKSGEDEYELEIVLIDQYYEKDFEITCCLTRDENNEELSNRLERNRLAKERRKKEKTDNTEIERKLYEKLKKKFE